MKRRRRAQPRGSGNVTEQCGNCRFWSEQPSGTLMGLLPHGLCRRFPPISTPPTGAWLFPMMLTKGWCGEWQRRK